MSHSKRVVFIDGNGTVLNVLVGDFDEQMMRAFIDFYAASHGAAWGWQVDDASVPIWIGGRYDNEAGFLPPPDPEIVEGTSEAMPAPEPLPEPLPEPETEPEV